MKIRHQILKVAEAHRIALRMRPTPYSRLASGDPKFLANLSTGRGVSLRTIERAEAFILSDPAGLDLSGTILSAEIPILPSEEARADG